MRFLIIAVVCCLLNSCTGGEKGKSGSEGQLTEAEVLDFIREYDDTWAKRDTIAMKNLMSGDYVYFSSTGSTIDRNRILSWFTPPDKYKVDTAFRDQIKVALNGNTAIVSSHWVGSGSFAGEKFSDDQRCSLVIQRRDGKIRIISEHCTQIVK